MLNFFRCFSSKRAKDAHPEDCAGLLAQTGAQAAEMRRTFSIDPGLVVRLTQMGENCLNPCDVFSWHLWNSDNDHQCEFYAARLLRVH